MTDLRPGKYLLSGLVLLSALALSGCAPIPEQQALDACKAAGGVPALAGRLPDDVGCTFPLKEITPPPHG